MKKHRIVEVLIILGIVAVLAGAFLPALFDRPQESGHPPRCLNNLKQHGLALTQYAQDYDGCYPWRVGAVDAKEAWRDLGLLFPSYNSSLESFICRSSRDRKFDPKCASGAKKEYPLEPFLPTSNREVISYAYCVDARDPDNPKAWTEEAPATLVLMADKKAGYPIGHVNNPATMANHKDEGRHVLYHDGHVEWKAGIRSLDPDETDDEVGPPGAKDYRAWWSDPPFYGE